jgi:SAM-dependent methyltransferase
MLEVARELSPGIEFVQGSVDSISFGDDTFDAATIQQGLQFFPDRLAALAEVRRVVQPGGRVVVACWSDPDQGGFGILADAIGRHVSESAGSMARAPFVVSDEGDLRSLFEESGYDDVSVQRETIRAHFPGPDGFADRLISAGPIVTVFDGQPPAARVAVEADITAEIQQYRQEGEIVFPMPTLIATATA